MKYDSKKQTRVKTQQHVKTISIGEQLEDAKAKGFAEGWEQHRAIVEERQLPNRIEVALRLSQAICNLTEFVR